MRCLTSMNRSRRRRGITLVEVSIAGLLMTSLLVALLSLGSVTSKEWAKSSAKIGADTDASVALQQFAYQVRDGISATVSDGVLTVVMPLVNSEGDYNRYVTGDTVDFYVEDGTLYRQVSGSQVTGSSSVPVALASGISSHSFAVAGREVSLSVTTEQERGIEKATTTYHTQVALRNQPQ